jgi:hypothetical protein
MCGASDPHSPSPVCVQMFSIVNARGPPFVCCCVYMCPVSMFVVLESMAHLRVVSTLPTSAAPATIDSSPWLRHRSVRLRSTARHESLTTSSTRPAERVPRCRETLATLLPVFSIVNARESHSPRSASTARLSTLLISSPAVESRCALVTSAFFVPQLPLDRPKRDRFLYCESEFC